ncbi:MAG TPA: FlgD immunoglobulin-like domain containing protein [Candidatus Krumholzibacteria bacterium]|nr:FlgD immunoglobulin-like domain containing protein [Candidatus Krumholzibacteria bacterium]
MRPALLFLFTLLAIAASSAEARRSGNGALSSARPTTASPTRTWDNSFGAPNGLSASASQGTTVLYAATFNSGASCTDQGWTSVDVTAELGEYWHVDDFAGLNPANYAALAGTKSLWCGARPSAAGPLCNYSALPGYGNLWNQAFCTKACIAVSGDGILDVAFLARFDSEPSYDATTLEYTLDCAGADGWTVIDGGIGVWDGLIPTASFGGAYNIGTTGPVKVRIYFESDGAWSDQDGLWNSNGAVVVDNLAAEGLAVEDFEGEAVNATESNDWITCNPPGYGIYTALFPGATLVQEDPCARDISCVWAAINGSTYDYTCGGFPGQAAVPFGNADGQYLDNDIWSPDIPLAGAGATVNLEFSVYRDMPLDNLIFYTWRVRSKDASGCWSQWEDREFVYFGGQKDWLRHVNQIGDLLNLTTGVSMSVRFSVLDLCGVWCGTVGSGACHSHAPLFDNVKVYRVNQVGPQWSVRDIDQFQDNFAEIIGPYAGKARADMANDISPGANVNSIVPGDSSVVRVSDPVSGLGVDGGNSRAAVYCYVSVWPQGQATKTGAHLTQDPVRFPVTGSFNDAGGTPWTIVQCDSAIVNGIAQPDRYCVDLNDNLFEPGDTVCFFYEAIKTNALATYAFGSNLGAQSSDREEAAANPSEFTILPASGVANGDNILYVDGMDGRGAQQYWESGFINVGNPLAGADRFDVRGPSSGVSNRPAGRVKDISQLVPAYRIILWDTGDLETGLGNGSGTPEKTNDYKLVNQFLANVTPSGGVYIGGDDVAEQLSTYQSSVHPNGVDAITFKSTWLPHNLTAGNHRPSFGISPLGSAVAGSFLNDPSFVIYGGCPLINDFDVMEPQGTAVNQVTYGVGTATSANGALLSNVVGDARVAFGGFSLIYIRDDETNGKSDRGEFLFDLLCWFGSGCYSSGVPAPTAANNLDQNYPNPFNPRTTIAFSVKDRGLVTLRVYNVAGELVRTLANEEFTAGAHTKVWDGRNDAGSPVSSGVYFYKLVSNSFAQTKKMVLLK